MRVRASAREHDALDVRLLGGREHRDGALDGGGQDAGTALGRLGEAVLRVDRGHVEDAVAAGEGALERRLVVDVRHERRRRAEALDVDTASLEVADGADDRVALRDERLDEVRGDEAVGTGDSVPAWEVGGREWEGRAAMVRRLRT